jgi:hypothetical protein
MSKKLKEFEFLKAETKGRISHLIGRGNREYAGQLLRACGGTLSTDTADRRQVGQFVMLIREVAICR